MCPTKALAAERSSPWRTLPGLRVREIWYRPGAVQPRHRHGEGSLSLVVAGEIEEASPLATYRARAGSLVVKPADCPHADTYGPRGAHIVQISPRYDDEPMWSDVRWTYRWHEEPKFARSIFALLAGLRCGAESAELNLWEMLEGLFPDGTQPTKPRPGWWGDAVDLLNACCEQPISVGSVAGQIGVHPVHLARVCRAQFGCTVRQYIRRRRVLAAWRACQQGDTPLALIAARTGFSDQAHMTRAFTEVLGVSPDRLRRWTAHPLPNA